MEICIKKKTGEPDHGAGAAPPASSNSIYNPPPYTRCRARAPYPSRVLLRLFLGFWRV